MKYLRFFAILLLIFSLVGCEDDLAQELYEDYTLYEDSSFNTEGEGVNPVKEIIVMDKMANAEVTSSFEKDNVIPTSASFDVKFDADVTDEYVENTFSIKPYRELEVTKVNTKYYKLTAKNELSEDQIYNIEEKTTSGTKKWVFQTEKVFKVEYTYPANNNYITETGAPEIRFNNEIDKNIRISDYITIEPNISGTWKKAYSYTYRFEHNNHFEKDKTYTITIKKGLKDIEGNVLAEDYVAKFNVNNEQDIGAYMQILNVYKPNTKIDLNISLSMNLNKGLSINKGSIKVLDLGSKEEYIKALKDIKYKENEKFYSEQNEYSKVFEKDIKDIITNEYNKAKAEKQYYYYQEVPINSNLMIDKEGYYLMVLYLNDTVSFAPFEINNATATCSILSSENFMILYKGTAGNSTDVYLNDEKLGTTDNDGMLYIENFRSIVSKVDKETNYIEFKDGSMHLIVDISNQISEIANSENGLTSNSRHNNGYIYVDRKYYKPGETVYYWGYAKNRKINNIKDAKLVITSNYDDVLQEVPLTLSDVGTFEGEFTIDDVNKESYISLELYIGKNVVNTRYIEVRDYELKQYNISLKPEAISYIDGEDAVVNITAETYDGTPLDNLEFKYEINNKYYYNDNIKSQNGSVTTDEYGTATIKVPLKISKNKNNILPEFVRLNILNSYIDGEQENITFTLYPYKHYAEGSTKFIVDENKYYLDFKEYLSLDNDTPANDSIKVVANAYKTVKKITGTRYNKYTKEMEDIIEYNEVAEPAYDKTFTVKMADGKGNATLDNYKTDKNCYYRFKAYLITDDGRELAITYDGSIYGGRYKTIYSTTEYEEVEYVDPVITPELTYYLHYENNDKLKVGDEVEFYMQDDQGRRLNDYSKFEFYTLVSSAEGNKIIINKGEKPHFTFTKEMGANCATYTVCYDTLKAYSPSSNAGIYYYTDYYVRPITQIRLCEEELSLKIDLEFDKKAYEPKDEAEVTIKVTDNGKGVKAGVNISALDTAYIAANGQADSYIISSLYNNYYINSANGGLRTTSQQAYNSARPVPSPQASEKNMAMDTAMVEESMVAEAEGMGAGDDEDSLRDDLKTTAFFESLVTDENGIAKVKIKLPDNITEWTIKAHAISNGFKAKDEEKKIKVSKDFFVSLNHKDRYLVGEHFAFNIKSFSKLYSGKNVSLKVEILDSNNKVLETKNVESKAQEVLSYKVNNPIDKAGTYKIKITGKCEGIVDSLVEEFDIVESLLDATIRENMLLNVGDQIVIVSPKGYIYILNEDVAKILPTIFELSFLYNNERNDTSLISNEASRIFSNLCNGNEFEYGYKYTYDADKLIFKVLNNSSDDARLALRMLSTKAWLVNQNINEVLDKIEVRLGNTARLWAKVNMKKASLKELRAEKEKVMADSSSYTKQDVLYLALAFADIGSTDDAISLYNIVKNQITAKEENEFELKVTLALKLNLEEAEELYKSYLAKEEDLLPENSDFIKLFYVQSHLDKNFKPGSITLSINGADEEVKVNNVGLTRKLISRNDNIRVVKMTDNLSFMIEQYKPVDFNRVPKNKYIISKSYNLSNAKEGDMVEVSIIIDNKKMYDDGIKYGYKIEDAIPNNMTFVEYLYGKELNGYLRKQDGQKLTISIWNPYDPKWNPSALKSTIKYKARITNGGEQYEPGTIMLRYNNEIIDGIK